MAATAQGGTDGSTGDASAGSGPARRGHLAVAMTAVLVPAAGAAAPSCRVKNPTQDTWFATRDGRALTRAIAAANPGDRLNVFGACRGNYVVDKDLRVFGNPQATAPTTLDGRGSGRSSRCSPTRSPASP
jgi:nitrous oxidase accessory protein NosD